MLKLKITFLAVLLAFCGLVSCSEENVKPANLTDGTLPLPKADHVMDGTLPLPKANQIMDGTLPLPKADQIMDGTLPLPN